MVYIFHDALLFVIDMLSRILMFGFLQCLTLCGKVSAHSFILTSITVELNTAIGAFTYSRAFDTNVYAHDIAIVRTYRFIDMINYLCYNTVIFNDNTHSAKFITGKCRLLLICHLCADGEPFRFTVYHNREFNMIAIDLEVLIIDIAARLFHNRKCSHSLDILTLFG